MANLLIQSEEWARCYDTDRVDDRAELKSHIEGAYHCGEPIGTVWLVPVEGAAPERLEIHSISGQFDENDYADRLVSFTRSDRERIPELPLIRHRIDGRS